MEYIRHKELEGNIDLSGREVYLDLGEEGVRRYVFGKGFSVSYRLTDYVGGHNAFGVDLEFEGNFFVGSNGTKNEHIVYGETRTELIESIAITLSQSRISLRETLRDSRKKIRTLEKEGKNSRFLKNEQKRYQKARQEYKELTKVFKDQGRVRDSNVSLEEDYTI